MLEAFEGGNDFFSAASALGIPPELLDFKVRMMRYKGHKLNASPVYGENGFLKNIRANAAV